MSTENASVNDLNNAEKTFIIRIYDKISTINEVDWCRLCGASKNNGNSVYNPFISHAFLSALEDSGCAIPDTGWHGQHLILEDSDGVLHGAIPAYIKSHSQGEYVFDHAWADAYVRAGGHYYPKLQASVPFTPASGPRLLTSEHNIKDAAKNALANGIMQLTNRLGLSSAHVTFAGQSDMEIFKKAGFLHRMDQQFHFKNDAYRSYTDFLDTLASRKRKNLKKERCAALSNGITVKWFTGNDITEDVMDAFYQFYMDTGARKWGRPYLNREFYSLICERMRQDILLVMAVRDKHYIAGAINFIGGDTLFGRHWGCIEHHPFLHFEVCYHQAIDFAIEHGLQYVEAGAQGEHKLARGYMPTLTHSAHYLPNENFRDAVEDYLQHERSEVVHFEQVLNTHTPFKNQNSRKN